jgi:mannose-6-phosphate isomerase
VIVFAVESGVAHLYPLLFEPVLKDYLWGGRNLARLGRALPPEGAVAESWEIAAHEDGTTVVKNGPYAGKSLTALRAELGLELIGTKNAWAQARGKFPLLIKLLDAAQPLSVQVHPNDDYALEHEGNELGKTEMWVVLEAQPGAELILGVSRGTTRESLREALLAGHPEPHLHRFAVHAGDHLCVPAGTLHAIMGGLIIAEIQQNSNTTYRVYDWNRVGPDGRARELHVDKALEVIDFDAVEPGACPAEVLEQGHGYRRSLLCHTQYFVTERVDLDRGATYRGNCDGSTLEIWGVIGGEAVVGGVRLGAVRFALLPAALGPFTVTSEYGATLLRTYVS